MIKAYRYILKTFIRTSVFFAGRFTLSQSSPPVRNATYLRTFFWIYLSLSKDFVNQHIFLLLDFYIEIAQNSYEECNEVEDLLFWRQSLCLSRDSCPVTLAHIRSLYFIQVYIFIPLINSAPFLRFSYILLYTIFFSYVHLGPRVCTLLRKIFSLSLMTLLLRI